VSAEKIRQKIKKEKMRYFTVPDKWLYKVSKKKYYILVVQDMQLVSHQESEEAWREKVTKRHLQELYRLEKQGYTSVEIAQNIPYTRRGKFSCIDTEYSKRTLPLARVKDFLSPRNKQVWDSIREKTNRYGRKNSR
jgi:hypothetical protein